MPTKVLPELNELSMKRFQIVTNVSIVLSFLVVSSCSRSTYKVLIVKDCTGSYIQWNNKDYRICNPELTDDRANGSRLRVNFHRQSSCPLDTNQQICALYHPTEGYVKIVEIK